MPNTEALPDAPWDFLAQTLGALSARSSNPMHQETDQRMTISEPFMTRITVFLAVCVVGLAIGTTLIGWLGAALFIAGYATGLVTPRSG